jgi:hypothetical protein
MTAILIDTNAYTAFKQGFRTPWTLSSERRRS